MYFVWYLLLGLASGWIANLIVKGEGTTKFWVIPTANTPLWQEVSITIHQPRLRLSASGKLRKVGSSLRII